MSTFFRALQKKIRAEEMLRASRLPPSMAKRETTNPRLNVCPRSYRDSLTENNVSKKLNKIPNYKAYHDRLEKELEDLKNDFISTSPRPFKLKTSKRVSILLPLFSESGQKRSLSEKNDDHKALLILRFTYNANLNLMHCSKLKKGHSA